MLLQELNKSFNRNQAADFRFFGNICFLVQFPGGANSRLASLADDDHETSPPHLFQKRNVLEKIWQPFSHVTMQTRESMQRKL